MPQTQMRLFHLQNGNSEGQGGEEDNSDWNNTFTDISEMKILEEKNLQTILNLILEQRGN